MEKIKNTRQAERDEFFLVIPKVVKVVHLARGHACQPPREESGTGFSWLSDPLRALRRLSGSGVTFPGPRIAPSMNEHHIYLLSFNPFCTPELLSRGNTWRNLLLTCRSDLTHSHSTARDGSLQAQHIPNKKNAYLNCLFKLYYTPSELLYNIVLKLVYNTLS